MLPILHIGCTALKGTNKVGKLACDADGYYRVVLGALEYPNKVGAVYSLQAARKLIEEESSSLMRQIKAGNLRGECEHPKPDLNRPMSEYLARIMRVETANVSHHIRNVWIDANAVDAQGKSFIAIYGDVKPTGPMGSFLKEILDDKNQNCSFSIRSITNDEVKNGRIVKHLTRIVTWDWVNDPGLDKASKYHAMGLESFDLESNIYFNMGAIKNQIQDRKHEGISLESDDGLMDLIVSLESTPTRSDTSWKAFL